ncbi:hypothetical protein ACQPWR_21790 [Micromonospora vinacea]|uniref:hypothetical protein n=1 Tax=Micromonospora vinacea TaxID=709878 RepID=UPI003D8E9ED0
MTTRRMSARLAGIALLAAAVTYVVPATPASAACGQGWSDRSSRTAAVTANGVRYRTGPHTSCTAYGQVNRGVTVYLDCATRGDTVNGIAVWWHARFSTGGSGFISGAYLNPWVQYTTENC